MSHSLPFFAHTTALGPETWEPLERHLDDVAVLAERFASAFAAADWGRLAGLWHDLGKYSHEFQERLVRLHDREAHLEDKSSDIGRVDHSTAGARHAASKLGKAGRILAFVIAGHHAGLANYHDDAGEACLAHRLDDKLRRIPDYSRAPATFLDVTMPSLRPRLTMDRDDERRYGFQLSLFCRMLFSSLVDADFLATERFMAPERAVDRPTQLKLSDYLRELNRHLDQLAKTNVSQSSPSVNQARQSVLAACRSATRLPPGLFSLTVPTGGGKTLASLAFALEHAKAHSAHGFRRVIMAIPFTSIIEQTAEVYREAFAKLGPDAVLEHHSNLDREDPRRQTAWSRLAAENWDAPLVVTTNVQFFESFFATRTSRCRKLHNVARSVVILDEAQTLPVKQLRPCLALLRELATDYGCSIVLCTATQPAIERRDDFSIGLAGVREIIPQPVTLYEQLRRVETRDLGVLDDDALVDRLTAEAQALTIVNTRRHAARLFQTLAARWGAAPGLFHLSTHMCGAHRAAVLDEVRRRLSAGEPCHVVSTQLIEAGVDIDFPVVYRSLAGFDALAQAAGRCNRHGLRERGTLYVFTAVDVNPPPYLARTAQHAQELMPTDPLRLESVRRYFELHYWAAKSEWGTSEVMRQLESPRCEFGFRNAEAAFQMIEQAGRPVIVPYGTQGMELVDAISSSQPPDWRIQRRLQRYVVNVFDQVYQQLVRNGDVAEYHDQYSVLVNDNCYDAQLGLTTEKSGIFSPEDHII